MNNEIFFKYYLPSLKKALSEDHINYGFHVKDPSWFYPKDKILNKEITDFEDSHYQEFPILEIVAYYFDSKSHHFPDVGKMNIDECRKYIIKEMNLLAQIYNIKLS